jgi:hypothetical protein
MSLQDLLNIMCIAFDDYSRKQHAVKVLATYIPQQGPLENVCHIAMGRARKQTFPRTKGYP